MPPDWNQPFVLFCDASGTRLGVVLSQPHAQHGEVNIVNLSPVLDKHERNYTLSKREMLAVVWAVRNLGHNLHGQPFKVVTDHHALTYLSNLKDPQGRLSRWALELSLHKYTIE